MNCVLVPPISLKHMLAQELVKGLLVDPDSLLRYNWHGFSESCASTLSFGRFYPGGAALLAEAKNLFEGIGCLLATYSSKELSKPVEIVGEKIFCFKNGSVLVLIDGVMPSA